MNESSSISSISNDFTTLTTSTSSCTAVRVNDDALDPLKGKLACRLVGDGLDHLPIPKNYPSARCAMHRWATAGDEVYSDVLFCPACRVNLCVTCYKPFHRDPDLVQNKDEYCPKKPASKRKSHNKNKNNN